MKPIINIKEQKIDAIRAVREFCSETFGANSGLKETKDFVELMIPQQAEKLKEIEYRNVATSLDKYSQDELNKILKIRGLKAYWCG